MANKNSNVKKVSNSKSQTSKNVTNPAETVLGKVVISIIIFGTVATVLLSAIFLVVDFFTK